MTATTVPAVNATSGERQATGRAARRTASRSSHATWEPPADRRDPVEILEEQAATRLAELVPIRHGRMLVSPFTFYRGAAAIMAADLAHTPASGLTVQLCGDAHLSNFGIYASPERRLVFDLNDFDETLPGPFEWDVKRLAASLEIAGRERSFKNGQRRAIVLGSVRAYREAMRRFAGMGNLEVWYARMDVDELIRDAPSGAREADVRSARHVAAKARQKDSLRAVTRLTETVDGRVRIASDPPLVVRIDDLLPEDDARLQQQSLQGLLSVYQQSLTPDRRHLVSTYRYVDMARKVVGVGSVGTRAWIVLLEGRDGGDPLVLQAKEAQPSVLERHLAPCAFATQGERVVHGQRLMQAASDIFLGWQRATGLDGVERDFYVRQLWDGKGSADVETMPFARMALYGRLCGEALARGHARSGDRVAIAAYLGGGDAFDRALAAFAEAYAEQNALDHRALADAVDAGRVEARSDL